MAIFGECQNESPRLHAKDANLPELAELAARETETCCSIDPESERELKAVSYPISSTGISSKTAGNGGG